MLDRIDLHIDVPPADLHQYQPAENSSVVRARVIVARNIQLERTGICNALMTNAMLREYCALGKTETVVLQQAMVQHKLSARSYERILKMARTVADLAGSSHISLAHLAEAISYRVK